MGPTFQCIQAPKSLWQSTSISTQFRQHCGILTCISPTTTMLTFHFAWPFLTLTTTMLTFHFAWPFLTPTTTMLTFHFAWPFLTPTTTMLTFHCNTLGFTGLSMQLSETYPQLEHNDQLSAFPTGGGFGAQKDPQSEFVQKRKAALELYFRALFGVYPALLKHPRIVEFFELDYLPPDISAAVSFGSKSVPVFELSGNTDHYRGRYADKDDVGVNGEGEGGTEQQRPQGSAGQGTQGNRGKAGWVRYDDICDRSVLAEVERTGLTYDIKSATLVRADEPVDNSAGTMTSIADILSYAPSYTVLPSVFARTLSPEPPVVSQGLGPNPEARSIRSDQ